MSKTVCKILILFQYIFYFSSTGYGSFQDTFLDGPVKEGVYKESIKSICIHREGWKLSYPVFELNDDTGLEISFDDIRAPVCNYSYRIIHCDNSWNPSLINENEYIEGIYENQILNYSFSFNTNINYIHYTLKFPNEDINVKISGNYILVVYEDFNIDKLVFIKRFIVTEKIADIKADVKRPVLTAYRNSGQEIDFKVIHGNYPIHDPFSEINITILQNGRWDNTINNLKPLYLRNGVLEYDYNSENVFPGGSEFRWFDIKSLRYQSPYIKNIIYENNMFHIDLFPDENRSGKLYFFEDDLNGKFYIEVQEHLNNDIEADYAYVHFSLPYSAPLVHGKLYLFGALTNWELGTKNELQYNFEKKIYEIDLLLKQGYYNYHYAFVPEGSKTGDLSYIEGNHYETENDYIILVYHRPVNSRYDRIIAYQIVNSLHKQP